MSEKQLVWIYSILYFTIIYSFLDPSICKISPQIFLLSNLCCTLKLCTQCVQQDIVRLLPTVHAQTKDYYWRGNSECLQTRDTFCHISIAHKNKHDNTETLHTVLAHSYCSLSMAFRWAVLSLSLALDQTHQFFSDLVKFSASHWVPTSQQWGKQSELWSWGAEHCSSSLH